MPIDLQAVFARRREAKAQSDAHTTLALVCAVLTLAVLVLLFVSHGFAQAVEWMGEIEF